MNINYIIGIAGTFGVFLLGCVMGINIGPSAVGKDMITFELSNLWNFFDAASIFITIGCTLCIVVASFPGSMLKAMPKHFKIILNNKLFDPKGYIEQLVELAGYTEEQVKGMSLTERIAATRKYREAQYQTLIDAVYPKRGWTMNGVPTVEHLKELDMALPELLEVIQPLLEQEGKKES